jgi:hypothetical protein
MAKPNPLQQGLRRARTRDAAPAGVAEAAPKSTGKKEPAAAAPLANGRGRAGKALIGGFWPLEVRDQLKLIAVEQRTTQQALLTDALNTVFARYGKPEIAGDGEGE